MTTGKKILLAEDDRFLRRACATALARRGYEVVIAEDGKEALAAARSKCPDLLLLDLLMPKMTGLEVLRLLRADPSTRDIPVIILSNSSREADLGEAKKLDVKGYLVKANLSLEALGEHVSTLLGV
jgi:CheY-like chemotaxis protein